MVGDIWTAPSGVNKSQLVYYITDVTRNEPYTLEFRGICPQWCKMVQYKLKLATGEIKHGCYPLSDFINKPVNRYGFKRKLAVRPL